LQLLENHGQNDQEQNVSFDIDILFLLPSSFPGYLKQNLQHWVEQNSSANATQQHQPGACGCR